jgi:hypothetical protein
MTSHLELVIYSPPPTKFCFYIRNHPRMSGIMSFKILLNPISQEQSAGGK